MLRNISGRPWLLGLVLLLAWGPAQRACAYGNASGSTNDTPLIDALKIDSRQLATLSGTVPLQVSKSKDLGAMGQTEVIPSMTLVLKRSPELQNRFNAYVASLNDPASPNFHQWFTAEQIGQQFGPNASDVTTVTKWLNSQGLGVKSVSPDRMRIRFSGSVAAVERAFATSIHRYTSEGQTHFANAAEQQLPSALTSVVAGVAALNDFFPKPLVENVQAVKRDTKGHWVAAGGKSDFNFVFNNDVFYDVVPADFNTIYNVTPLWNQNTAIRGAGQTVAVLEPTDVLDADISTFRQTFLPTDAAGVFAQVHPAASSSDSSCVDPGTTSDEGEAALDSEWAGAAAPDANVTLASCANVGADFGAFLAAENLLQQQTPPAIMSLSYGECELVSAAVGDLDEAASLWSQAAAEGVTVFVSSGDAGSAACDQDESAASFGIAINGLGSSWFNVSVGGTDFNDINETSKYWLPGNGYLGQSAISYIPEQTWNSSCASERLYKLLGYSSALAACNSDGRGSEFLDTAAGGGGPSYYWAQPMWQTGIAGMPQTNTRAIPDVALFAANGVYGHALIYCMSDASEGGTPCNYLNPTDAVYNSAGGTSFAAPAMAGIQALINQSTGANHGNIGPTLYGLARVQYGTVASPNAGCSAADTSASCIFHDVATGDNDVPCNAGTGDCYTKQDDSFGVVSNGGQASLVTAWKSGTGYDYATGLGSVNVTNLVNAITVQEARKNIPRTWDVFGTGSQSNGGNPGFGLNAQLDGHSTLLLIGTKTGDAILVHMNGGTTLDSMSTVPLSTPVGVLDGFEAGDQVQAVPFDLFTGQISGQDVMESDNPTNNTTNLAVYSYGWIDFRFPYPAGWALVGAGIVDQSGVSKEIWFDSATGKLSYWSMSCTGTILFGQFNQMDCERTIGDSFDGMAGYTPRLADLNGDGYIDIVWTGPKNEIDYWINDGQGNFTKTNGGKFTAGWTLEGAGEVAGSGKTDLIWSNASGSQIGWWVMDGTTVVDRKTRSAPSGYSLASIEDFNGDGLADLLWINAHGDGYVWQGTGGDFVSQRVANGNGTAYVIPTGYTVQKNRLQGVTQLTTAPATNAQVALSTH